MLVPDKEELKAWMIKCRDEGKDSIRIDANYIDFSKKYQEYILSFDLEIRALFEELYAELGIKRE